ncbi:MAG: alkaline phosphatase [Saprospiraceae bacterium]
MKQSILLLLIIIPPLFINAQTHPTAPFYHGVASGDPLTDAVIIWTRAVPINTNQETVIGKWFMSTDKNMKNVVQTGDFKTDASKDYTIKIDVQNLESNTYYYYQFETLGKKSIIGRTKTAPKSNDSNHLRFAVVSCNNYQHGYFNAFRAIANQTDLDAVVHLGDYIYETGEGVYADEKLNRNVSPLHEILDLKDYRMRYGQYRLDADFIKIHQQHPFICIWDDHEIANDSYKDGAQNHQKNEGDWEARKAAAKQAYFEWLPIRNHPEKKINRILKYGELADLIMLDTRIEAREKKPTNMYDANYMDSSRVMLGKQQREWLFEALDNSTAKWKLIGQQVIFSELVVGWANPLDRLKTENILLDIWDGYPVERQKIMDYLTQKEMKNVVFLTGDFHSAFAFEVTANPTLSTTYNSETSEGAVAVEFVVPSISSANFDEYTSRYRSRKFEECLNKPCGGFPFFNKTNPNPHIKYTDLDRHGFIILDVTEKAVQSNFYYINRKDKIDNDYYFDAALKVNDGSYHLEFASENQPKTIDNQVSTIENTRHEPIISGIYQTETDIFIQLHSSQRSDISNIYIVDDKNNVIKHYNNNFGENRTIYTLSFSKSNLPKGKYGLTLNKPTLGNLDKFFFEIQ